ncbi:uncharacterized protein LOC142165822 [Nicotiana tabacum]|uniref:Uncharacterized protein LOC142165822 n=1 Tax=Nicotiana tabacum TaxID=4097 RepID=A0AC58S5N6_TOBAC
MAGIVSLLSSASLREWIIDSGATHHITCNKEVLNNTKELEENEGIGVQLPTGSRAEITDTGNAVILGDQCIRDFLYVPDFKFNLLFVAKLTKDLKCFVGFYPNFYLLQELYNGKVLGIGKKCGGLYMLKERGAVVAAGSISKEHTESALWHFRLPFPVSNSKSSAIFELVHLDVWGPYKNQFGVCVKIVRFDNGTEFFNTQCNELLSSLAHIPALPADASLPEDDVETHIENAPLQDNHIPTVVESTDAANEQPEPAYLQAFSILTEPRSFKEAATDKNWIEPMKQDVKSLEDNQTWEIKYKANGEVDRYKAKLVAKGYTQQELLDYHETFSPVAKMVTVRTVIAVATSNDWPLFHMDVNNAFL